MPDRKPDYLEHRRSPRTVARRRLVLEALSRRPRSQAELRDALGMSNSGIRHLLRDMERDGLIRPAERIAHTYIWERGRRRAR